MAKKSSDVDRARLQIEGYLHLFRAQRQIEARAAELLAREGFASMTLAQATALMVLVQEQQPITAARLSKLLSVSQVTVSRFVSQLEKGRWVKRKPHPDDARAQLLHPTSKTLDKLPQFLKVTGELVGQAYRGYSERDVRTLVRLLERTVVNLDRGESDAA